MHPALLETDLEGKLADSMRGRSEEKAIVALLKTRMKDDSAAGGGSLTPLLARSLAAAARRLQHTAHPVTRGAP